MTCKLADAAVGVDLDCVCEGVCSLDADDGASTGGHRWPEVTEAVGQEAAPPLKVPRCARYDKGQIPESSSVQSSNRRRCLKLCASADRLEARGWGEDSMPGLWLLWLSGRPSCLHRRRDRSGPRMWRAFHAAAVGVVEFSEAVGEDGRAVPSQLSGESNGGEEELQAVGPCCRVEEHSLSPGRSPHGDGLPYFVQRVRIGQVMCWLRNAFCTEHAGQAVGLKDVATGHGQCEVREADVGRARGLKGGNERPDDGASGPVPEGRDRSLSCASGGDDGLSPSRYLRYG